MSLTYQNPVWSGYLADPFVLKRAANTTLTAPAVPSVTT
jgi:hypothetical protein